MYVALENRRKIETKSPQSASHEKNKVGEGGALGSGVKKE